MSRIQRTITIALAVVASLVPATSAQAHTITSQQCYLYGSLHSFVTGAKASTARAHCNVAAQTHRCGHAVGSMPRSTCVGMVRAARMSNAVPDSWAWNPSLHVLLGHESTWNVNAVNDSSNACGLFQRLVSTDTGCPWRFTIIGYDSYGNRLEIVHASATTQAANGYGYIIERYGTPEAALSFWNANGSY